MGSRKPQSSTIIAPQSILRLPAIKSLSGLSRSSIYNRIAEGLWPKPIGLGARAVGWPELEVLAVNSARIAGQSNEEVRALVTKLEADRQLGRQV